MPWVRQLPSGRWAATIYTGKPPPDDRITQTDRLKTVVTRWAEDLEADIRSGRFIDPRRARTTVADVWERYEPSRRLERASRKRDLATGNAGDLRAAVAQTEANKGKESSVLGSLVKEGETDTGDAQGDATDRLVKNIVFACDAGMGSSAMGATVLRNKMKKAGVEGVTVTNQAIANLDGTADLVITQRELTERAKGQSPNSQHVSVDNFMNSPVYDQVVDQVKRQSTNQKEDANT